MQQVFADANMVEISPSNTDPELTQGKDWATGKKTRPFKTYFRTATTDAIQGDFAADYAYNTLKKRSVFVVDDKQTYGAGLAGSSRASSRSSAARSSAPTTSTPATPTSPPSSPRSRTPTPTWSTTAASTTSPSPHQAAQGRRRQDPADRRRRHVLRHLHPDRRQGRRRRPRHLRRRARRHPARRPGLHQDLQGGRPQGRLRHLRRLLLRRRHRHHQGRRSVVEATTASCPTTPAPRSSTPSRRPSSTASTGTVSFDEYGDTTNKQLTVYQVDNGKWKAVKSGTFNG